MKKINFFELKTENNIHNIYKYIYNLPCEERM